MSGSRRRPNPVRRRGFTLVEMLVSVALVVLMMLMFAEIFGLASDAVSSQKGAAVNDQKVRTFTTLLTNDVKSRTFRTVMPFAGMGTASTGALANYETGFNRVKAFRRGYFSISENDPNNPSDDVLSFTIDVDSLTGFQNALLYGRASSRDSTTNNFNTADYPLDQPEFDDGIAGNGQGASTLAEVAYFLRNGNLCRSVMLIREPHVKGAPEAGAGDQPNQYPVVATPLFDDSEARFWNFFDYSAYREPASGRVFFHTESSLENDFQGLSTGLMLLPDLVTNVPRSTGIPHLRSGHTLQGNGGPMESVGGTVIGRFLKQELAHASFDYPGVNMADQSQKAGVAYNATTGLVTPFGSGTSERRGEELLVPFVHEFDVEVWDDGTSPPQWTNLGGSDGGFYDAAQNQNIGYGNRFDTWHPRLGDQPPFRPFRTGVASPDGWPGSQGNEDADAVIDFERDTSTGNFIGDTNLNGLRDANETGWIEDADEQGWIGSDDERPLRQIRVRVRFYDVKSGQVRQLSLILPLTESGSL